MLIITLYIHPQILKLINYISNCNFVLHLYIPYVILIITLYIHLFFFLIIDYIITCNFVPYLYFPYGMLIITLYIHLQILKLINYISKCNFVPCLYFPHGVLIITLYIHLQILKCILSIFMLHFLYIQLQILKYINCIINCNSLPYSYFPRVLSLDIPYIQLQTLKYINYILKLKYITIFIPILISTHSNTHNFLPPFQHTISTLNSNSITTEIKHTISQTRQALSAFNSTWCHTQKYYKK
jgi:hypothetical protein